MERTQIDAVLDRLDLVQLAEEAGAKFNRSMRSACPLHGGTNPTAFSVFRGEDGRQMWNCFTGECGSGDALTFIMKWKGLRFPDAVKFVGGEPLSKDDETRLAIQRAERAAQDAEQAAKRAREAVESLKQTEVWLMYHQASEARDLWKGRGIDESFQELWKLGYCAQKSYETKQGILTCSSITIPLFSYGWEVMNVKHRLLTPLDPNDKYRPETSGLTMPAYICDPDMTKDKAENILIVEGEIKAMVTYQTLDSPKWQVIGLPGKDAKRIKSGLVEDYKGRNCVVCLDPDGEKQAEELARELHGKMFVLPAKIDDMITKYGMDKETLRGVMRQSARI